MKTHFTSFFSTLLALTGSVFLTAQSTQAATLTWDPTGGGASDGAGAWLTAGDWWDGVSNVTWTSADDAIFGNGGAGGAVTLASPTTIGSLTFNSFSGTYTLGTAGQTIILNNGITMNSGAGAATIISPITLGAAQSWTNNDDSLLTIGTGAVINGGFLLTIGGAGNTSISSIISDTGGLTKQDAGTLTLSGANSFSGQLTVQNGTLSIATINNDSANGTLGNNALSVILGNTGAQTGTMQYTGVTASSTKKFTMAAGGTGAFDVSAGGQILTLSGLIDGSGGLTKTGNGTLTLSGSNTYTGLTTISAGILRLGAAGDATNTPLGTTAAGTVVSTGAALDLNGFTLGTAEALTINGTGIAGGGALINSSTTTSSTYSGLLTLGSASSIVASNASGHIVLSNVGTITGSGFGLTLDGASTASRIDSIIGTGAGTLTKNGAGTWSLTGANTYTGVTTLNAGTLTISGAAGSIATSTGITLNGGGLTLTNTTTAQGGVDRVSNSAGITSNGGTLTYTNTSGSGLIYGETIGEVDLVRGQLNTILTNNMAGGGGNIQTLTLSGLTRTGGTNTSAVTFSGNTLNTTTNIIRVNGIATSTTAGQIIGPWATVGTTAAAQTDYAVYNSDGTFGRVVAANIAATTENTWNSGANVTLNAAATLTGQRSLNTLRYTGGAGTLDLSASNLSLQTYGILNGGSGTLTISTNATGLTGTGGLTTSTGGGNLYLTTGNAAITVSAPIMDNGGAVTLVKSGSNTLTLSGANTFSGGIVLNAGQLTTSSDVNLGNGGGVTVNGAVTWDAGGGSPTYNRSVTVNDGGVLSFSNGSTDTTYTGVLSGNGALNVTSSGQFRFTNLNNTFTGTVNTGAYGFHFASLADSSNPINVGNGSVGFRWTGGATTFANRPFNLSANSGTADIENNGTGALVIQQNLGITGAAGNRTLQLAGSNTGNNIFSGLIANGTNGGTSVVSLTKAGAGTWTVSGNNTFTGSVSVGGGRLNLTGTNAYTGSTSFSAGGTLAFNSIRNYGTPSSLGAPASGDIAISNFGPATLIYLGGGDTTNRTISYPGDVSTRNQNSGIFNNGTGTLTFTAGTFNTSVSGNAGRTNVLNLGGTYTGGTNDIQGIIQDNVSGALLGILKVGDASTWQLSGNNTYTGATTVNGGTLRITGTHSSGSGTYTVNGGRLQFDGTKSGSGAVAINAGGTLSGIGTLAGAVTTAVGTTAGNGGAINLINSTAAQSLTFGNTLTFNGTTANPTYLYFDLGAGVTGTDNIVLTTASALPTASGGVRSVQININPLGAATPGTYTVIQGGTGASFSATNYALATTRAGGNLYTLGTSSNLLQVTVAAGTPGDATAFWTGAASTSWGAANWQQTVTGGGAASPGYNTDVTFSSTTPVAGNLTTVLNGDYEIRSLTFNTPGTGGVSITGATNTLTINNAAGITTNNSSGTNTISSKVGLGTSQTWTVASGGTLTASGGVYDFGAGHNLTKSGGGTLVISGAANYTGSTTITGGTFDVSAIVGGANAITPLATSSIAFTTASSTFKAAGSGTALVSYPSMSVASGITATFDRGGGGNNTAFAISALTGGGTFALANSGGAGTSVTFGNAAGFTGSFDFNNTQGNAINTPDLTDAASSKIRMSSGSASFTPSFNYTGSADVTLDNRQIELYGTTANTVFAINNNGTGVFTINTNLANIASGTKTLTLGGTATGVSNVFGGTISNGSGTINLTKAGASTWVLTNANAYTGATTISGGTLQLGNGGTTGALTGTTVNIANAGNLTINRSNPFTQATDLNGQIITGAGSLTLNGSGGVTLSGSNTYSGATNVNAGTLTLTNNLALQNSALYVNPSATLILSGTTTPTIGGLNGNTNLSNVSGYSNVTNLTLNPQTGVTATYSGILSDGASGMNLVKSGAGTQVLAGPITYTGTTTISAGTLQMSPSLVNVFGDNTVAIEIANTARLLLAPGTALGSSAGISGLGGYVISNPITLTGASATIATSQNGAKHLFSGNITASGIGTPVTLNFLNNQSGSNTGGDRSTVTFSGVISNGSSSALSLAFTLRSQTGGGANDHPAYGNLTGLNTFTGNVTAINAAAGATSWLTIGGERWVDGSNNEPSYGRMGSGRLADNASGVYAGNFIFSSTAANVMNLVYFSSANQTWSGVVGASGGVAGSLLKEGSGTLTLSNANLYNSFTTIGGGTLRLGFDTTTTNILPSTTPLWMGLGTSYSGATGQSNTTVISGGGGGGTLEFGGADNTATYAQTVASLNTAANTTSRILHSVTAGSGTQTLTVASSTLTIGANSGLNFDLLAGGANGATIGTGRVVLTGNTSVGTLNSGWTVLDAGGFGLAGTNASNQVIRNTTTAALVASGGSSATNYLTTSSSGNSVTATQSVGSITTDTTGGNVTLTISAAQTLSNNVWNFGGIGSNTAEVTGGTGVTSLAGGNTIAIHNYNTGSVTFSAPILNNGSNPLVVGGTGTVTLTGLNTYAGATTINSGTLQIGGAGRLAGGTYAGAIGINGGSVFQYSSSQAQTLSGVISGPGAITKDTSSSSDLTLSGTNVYTGTTTASAGRIVVTTAANLANGATSLVQSGTGQFYLNGGVAFANPLNLSTTGYTEIGDSQNNAMAVRMASGGVLANTVTLSGNSRIGIISNGYAGVTGRITGSFGIDFYGASQGNNGNQTFTISNTANDYTGNTTITSSLFNNTGYTGVSTTLRLGASNVIPNGASAGNVVFAINGTNPSNSVILDLAGFNETINGVTVNSGASAIITNSFTGASVLQIGDNNTTSSFGGTITDSGVGKTLALTKTGTGIVTLTNTNTYTGATNVNQGILSIGTVATPTGSINNSAVTINGGNFRYNSTTDYAGALTFTTGTISGTNWNGSLDNLTIGANRTISPGNSPGTSNTGGQTWATGGTYEWEINNVTATAGADPGWDLLNGSGTLDITAVDGGEFTIEVLSLTLANAAGAATGFNDATSYNWMIANFNAITGFSADAFTIDTTQFALHNPFTGTFGVALGDSPGIGGDNTQIWLTYTAIPEPKAALLGCLGVLLLLRRRR